MKKSEDASIPKQTQDVKEAKTKKSAGETKAKKAAGEKDTSQSTHATTTLPSTTDTSSKPPPPTYHRVKVNGRFASKETIKVKMQLDEAEQKLQEALKQVDSLKAQITELKTNPAAAKASKPNPLFDDPNDTTKLPHPLDEGIDHKLKYPVMTRYLMFPSATHGPSLYDTKRLLEEIIGYQKSMTKEESVELFAGRNNMEVVAAVVIPRHKDEKAFESYTRKSRDGNYVREIVKQMSMARVKPGGDKKKKKSRVDVVLEGLLKNQEASKDEENPFRLNLDNGARR